MTCEAPPQTDVEYNNKCLSLSGFLRTVRKRKKIIHLLLLACMYNLNGSTGCTPKSKIPDQKVTQKVITRFDFSLWLAGSSFCFSLPC